MISEYRLATNKIDRRGNEEEEEPQFNLSFNLIADPKTVERVEAGLRSVLAKCTGGND